MAYAKYTFRLTVSSLYHYTLLTGKTYWINHPFYILLYGESLFFQGQLTPYDIRKGIYILQDRITQPLVPYVRSYCIDSQESKGICKSYQSQSAVIITYVSRMTPCICFGIHIIVCPFDYCLVFLCPSQRCCG